MTQTQSVSSRNNVASDEKGGYGHGQTVSLPSILQGRYKGVRIRDIKKYPNVAAIPYCIENVSRLSRCA